MAKCREEEPDGEPVYQYLNPDIVRKGISLIPIVKQLSIVANQGCVRVASAAHQFLDHKMKILKASN